MPIEVPRHASLLIGHGLGGTAPVNVEHIHHQTRPGEVLGPVSFAGKWIVVFAESTLPNKFQDRFAYDVSFGSVTLIVEALVDEPVGEDPRWTPLEIL